MKKILILCSALFILTAFVSNCYAQTSTVKMNEIYSRGGSTTYAGLDWIELYNSGTAQIDISGYKIYDTGGQGGTKPKMTFPSGTVIAAKGFYVVATDVSTSTDPSGFGLSSNGEEVWLENASGTVIDDVTFLAMTETQTYGRYPDGGSTWKLLNALTRGVSNSVILMNEIYSRGGSTTYPGLDWIELYNSSSAAVDVSGYKIYDTGGQGGTKPKMTLAAGTSIPAKGYYVVTTDIATSTDPSGFGLSSGGEEVWLEDASANVIDNVVFPAMTETQSYARVPDGTTGWKLNTPLTQGATNGLASGIASDGTLIVEYKLLQNYPNPFNPTTSISFSIPQSSFVTLKVYDVIGKEVTNILSEEKSAGNYKVNFDASRLSSGVYFYKMQAGNFVQTKKMILMK
jgi:predicted extracellular nuclease